MAVFQYGSIEIDYLSSQDTRLGTVIERIGMIERAVNSDLFSALANAIVAQQISGKAAATVWKRLRERFPAFSPQSLASAPAEEIQHCGMSMRKVNYIQGAARAIQSGEVDLAGLGGLPDEQIIENLIKLPGIGVWTAEMLLIFSLQRPDVVSWRDLGIRRGMMRLYGLDNLTQEQFGEYRMRYSPYGTVASLYLWQIAMDPLITLQPSLQ